eukprot:m.184950 g.184950  ORF g.184950 m.184950 type:complete len:66 (-) comp14724_c0_seq4:1622-1819(-)
MCLLRLVRLRIKKGAINRLLLNDMIPQTNNTIEPTNQLQKVIDSQKLKRNVSKRGVTRGGAEEKR